MDCANCINVELVELTTGEKYYFCHEASTRVENIEFKGKECQCFEKTKAEIDECDYCSKQETYLEQYEAGEGSIRKLDIIFIPELRHLRVRILDDRENTPMNYGIDERFNYCPMCGRKL